MEHVTKNIYRWLGRRDLTPEEVAHADQMVKDSYVFFGIEKKMKQSETENTDE